MLEIKKIGNYRWTICALLFFASTINYLDRQVIGILKPLLESNLNIGEVAYANIVTIFQLCYGISMLLAGRLIDKFGPSSVTGYQFLSGVLQQWVTLLLKGLLDLDSGEHCWVQANQVTFLQLIKQLLNGSPKKKELWH